MDGTQIATLVVSAVTLVAGGMTIWRAIRRRRLSLATGKDPLRPHRFAKRRIIMGILMVVVAVLLYLGVFVLYDDFVRHPAWIGWYWLAVIVLLLWLGGLALFDMVQVMFSHYDAYRAKPPKKGD